MKKLIYIGALIFCYILSGCASIVSGSTQEVKFSSNPTGAIVWADGVNLGLTPVTANLNRNKKNQKIKIELEGYKSQELILKRKLNGWFFGNILLGGVIGIIIDASTGSMYNLSPKELNAELANGTVFNSKDGMYIGITLEANNTWKKIGNLESY
jgi:uncharacterized protein YceK